MRARTLPLLVGLVLLAPLALAATSLVTTHTNATSNEAHAFRNFDAPTSAVGDFDKDGVPEIVTHNDNQYVYVLATKSPRVLAEFRPDYPSGWGVRPINDPAVADVDGDGRLDIVVVNSAGRVCVYGFTGGSSSTSMSFSKKWCRTMDAYDSPGADAGPVVVDVNGDGRMEIFSQIEKKGLYAYNWDGSVRWSKNEFGGNSGPIVSDLDGDGKMEAVFFSDGGTIRAYDASSGASKWTFTSKTYVKPAAVPIAGSAADLDGDGKKEVVYVARDAHDATDYKNNHFMLFVLGHDGKLKWRAQPSWGNPMSYTHPVLIDVDGDGKRDILLQDWNTIGHKPGNWEKLGPANVFAYKGNTGALLWRTSLDNSWSNDDLAVADVDGDGKQEVLAIGYNGGSDGIWYLDLRTGAKESHVAIGSGWQVLRGPVAGNLLGDGKTSWAAPMAKLGSPDGGWKVFRTDAACNVGFGGTQNIFGCRGGSSGGGSTPPPPPPSGTFSASFSSPGGNEWWEEITVSANKALSGVDVRVNGGSWRPLELKWWGDWAESYHAPDGSTVQFRAQATTGETALSSCYRWTARTTVDCGSSGGGSTGGSFAATFKNVRGNEWWVETDVTTSGGTLTGVDARLDGGSWTALEKKSWGSWAKSFHAVGTIEFRARATDGQQVVSGKYSWPPS